ncbi:MAG: carbon starvation protein A [Fimbriimonadaceae bacterium]|nr:carbon starvation protein A [Fimbriimonadaceae bacterium]
MSGILLVVVLSAVILAVAYRTYGRLLARLLRLDPQAVTPAVELRDEVDYLPIEPKFLLGQHFSAIAAAGPIVGPILAGVMFGWGPALIWILVGCVFIGGVHDLTALVASVRHRACSIAEVVKEHMTHRSYLLFLAFVWIALVYIIVAFTDITAASFVGAQVLDNGQRVTGGGIATSSLLYLALPIVMGLLLRYTKLSLNAATWIFLPLVGVAIWVGQYLPFDVTSLIQGLRPGLDPRAAEELAHKAWDVGLLGYCFVAAVVPMWLLLQPRGHLGGYFLYVALGGSALGLVFGGQQIAYPAFTGWETPKGDSLFPMLFITIACGACSGFHSIIASGTTSKQLRLETDAKPIAYGAMLLEGLVAVVSLSCVMILAQGDKLLTDPKPNFIYARGIGSFLEVLGIPAALGVSFALMAFTTFVYDTLDVCTRLGRYIIEELLHLRSKAGRVLCTALTAGAPLLFVTRTTLDPKGNAIPVWKTFWALFGASNQLLAALTLLGVTVWLWRTRRERWVWLVTGVPTVLMYCMSVWALVAMIGKEFAGGLTSNPVPWVAVVLVALAALMLVEAVLIFVGDGGRGRPTGDELAVPA